jgi:hypothetical protein
VNGIGCQPTGGAAAGSGAGQKAGPGFTARLAARLDRALAAPLPERPVWQRVLYPLAGVALLALAVIGSLLPVVPGFLFAIPAVWLLCCSCRRWERAGRRALRGLLLRWRRRSRPRR